MLKLYLKLLCFPISSLLYYMSIVATWLQTLGRITEPIFGGQFTLKVPGTFSTIYLSAWNEKFPAPRCCQHFHCCLKSHKDYGNSVIAISVSESQELAAADLMSAATTKHYEHSTNENSLTLKLPCLLESAVHPAGTRVKKLAWN